MRALRGLFCLFIFLACMPVLGSAASILVSWNANTEDDLAGYKVYYGTASRSYGSGLDVGNVTSYRFDNVPLGRTYYIAVTAYDTSNNESGYSEEASITTGSADVTPPTGSIVINGGSSTTPSRTVTLTLSASDSGGSVAGMRFSNDGTSWSNVVAYATTYQWTLTAGDGTKTVYANFRDAAGNWMSTPVSDTIILRLDSDGDGMPDSWETSHGLNPNNPADASGDSDGDGISNLEEYYNNSDPTNPADNRPVANAGNDQTVNPTRVYLDGSKSRDPNGDTLQYTWSQVSGPVSVQIENANRATASFMGTKAGVYRFMLRCFDGKSSATDTVDITIRNVAPSVSAGSDMTIEVQSQVTLHATGSDPNGDALTYQWRLVSGSGVQLPNMNRQDISLTFTAEGQYRFSVTCSDGSLVSPADEVIVTVNAAANQAPTANAGSDQDVQVGERVTLNGSASSDPDGDTLSYSWRQTAGIQVNLQGAQTASPYFDAVSEGTREFELVVSDGKVQSTPDRVVIRVMALNNAPVADAGDDILVYVGELVTLSAAASYDVDGDTLTYAWTQSSGARVDLAGANTVSPSFTPTTSGVLTFTVRVSDGKAVSEASVTVTVDAHNQVPVADAGDNQTANIGEKVTLDGRASFDPDGDTISYIWSQVSGTRVSLSGSNTATPSFTPTKKGTYVFELRVYDGTDTSSPDTVTVLVQEEEIVIEPVSPANGAVMRDNPVFSWKAEGMVRFKVYASLDNKNFTTIYTGSKTYCSLHPVLWYWFIPSKTTIYWTVVGYDANGQSYTSSVSSVIKR
ncbi:MAG TPA: PKD domain-containing protein [Deltaproteobacteria bacterium]|nr:PKD domain-containing protein [Deltaproteobacteria bacterium]